MKSRGSLCYNIDRFLYREVCFVVKFAILGRFIMNQNFNILVGFVVTKSPLLSSLVACCLC